MHFSIVKSLNSFAAFIGKVRNQSMLSFGCTSIRQFNAAKKEQELCNQRGSKESDMQKHKVELKSKQLLEYTTI